jgi:hypothetical protein
MRLLNVNFHWFVFTCLNSDLYSTTFVVLQGLNCYAYREPLRGKIIGKNAHKNA